MKKRPRQTTLRSSFFSLARISSENQKSVSPCRPAT
jgi:hypothetical protein